jgi:hypothetical protein
VTVWPLWSGDACAGERAASGLQHAPDGRRMDSIGTLTISVCVSPLASRWCKKETCARGCSEMRQAKRKGRGRPKGTFSPSRWTPERIADLFWDAKSALRSLEAEGIIKRPIYWTVRPKRPASKEERVNKRLVAERLKRDFSQKYRDTTTEQLRQMLSKAYERTQNERVLEDFQAAVLANTLGETKNRE